MNTLKNDTNTALSNFNDKLQLLRVLNEKYEQVAVKLDIIDTNSKKDKEELNKLIHDKHVDFAN